jgi:hypothetical protein
MSKRVSTIVVSLFFLQLMLAMPSFAWDYSVSDVSLIPGADETQLNIAWHSATGEEGDTCEVKISRKRIFRFPSISSIYTGTTGAAGVDEDGVDDYYSEVVVTGLEPNTDYLYQLGDGYGNWSAPYEYTTQEMGAFSFFFIADPQIGASGPSALSKSRDIKPYIAEHKIRLDYSSFVDDGTLTDDDIDTLVTAYTDSVDTLANYAADYTDLDMDALTTAIDELYAAFADEYASEGYLTDLETLSALD